MRVGESGRRSPRHPLRVAALFVLALVPPLAAVAEAAALEDLADRLVGRSRSHVRGRAITEMQKLDPAAKTALVPLLLPGLQRKDAYERMNAAYALGLLDAPARPARDQLRPLLQDSSEMVRQQARATLGRLGEGRAAAVAAEIAEYRRRGGQDLEAQGARRSAIARLGYVLASEGERPLEGIATLAEALGDPHEYARHAAASYLVQVAKLSCADALPAVPALLGALREADRNTAHGALSTLEAMGLVRADPADGRTAFSDKPATRQALGERLTRDLMGGPTPLACPGRRPPA